MKPAVAARISSVIAGIVLATAASAEVRLESNPTDLPSVEVIATPLGPWSPTSPVTPVVLNPDGDLSGDSQPGWSARGGSALAAWVRPTTGTIEMAIGTDDAWTDLDPLEVEGAHRQPMVDPLETVWAITWQQDGPTGPEVYLTSASDAGVRAEPRFVANGTLVGTVPSRTAVNVIIRDPDTGELFNILVQVTYVPTQPMPIELTPGSPTELGMVRGPSLLGSCDQCAELRFDEIDRDGDTITVVSWWSDPATITAIEIAGDGPVLPVVTATANQGNGNGNEHGNGAGNDRQKQRIRQDALRQLQRR